MLKKVTVQPCSKARDEPLFYLLNIKNNSYSKSRVGLPVFGTALIFLGYIVNTFCAEAMKSILFFAAKRF